MVNILILEDEKIIANGISEALKQKGYNTFIAHTLKDASLISKEEIIHIAILDYMLPDGDGLSFSQTLPSTVKIVFLSAIDDEKIIIESLNKGYEDYITKPFRLPILLAKIQSIITRYQLDSGSLITYHHLHIDVNNQSILYNDDTIRLTKQETRLFFYFFNNRNRLLTREQLLFHVWESHMEFVNDNTLTVTLKRLRQKIELDEHSIIETVRGLGYKMKG